MPKKTISTFLDLPYVLPEALDEASIAVLGVSEASPYIFEKHSHSRKAPKRLRKISRAIARSLGQFDFDLGATMFPDKVDRRGMVDCGDVDTCPRDGAGNRQRIEEAVRAILAAGAVPIVLGGDDSVPIPVIKAFDGHGPLTILQIDAHVDWADVIKGNPFGYGSPMRRAAEFPHVTAMVQVGIRGLGSGKSWQHDDARAWGSRLVTSHEFHRDGLDSVLRHIPAGGRIFVSIDCDGIDPAVLPAVAMPTPGGLGYEDMIALMRGVAARASIAGLALVEYVPERDDDHALSGLVAARIATVIMGLAVAQAEQRKRAAPQDRPLSADIPVGDQRE